MTASLNIALIQSPLHWENPSANRAMFEAKIHSIPGSVDLIVLPEMFTTGFTMTPHHTATAEGEHTLVWMQNMARQKDAALVGSLAFWSHNKYYNRLFFIPPEGTPSSYDKRHTFTLAGEDKVYTAGTQKLIINYRGFTLCPLICYDLRFPVWARNMEGYDALLYVANWPTARIAAWDTLLRARAIENMAYSLGVNRVGVDGLGHAYPGHSAVYDTLGHSITYSEKEEILYATLEKSHITATRNRFRFLEDRDDFTLTK